jgi:hypothetical protein
VSRPALGPTQPPIQCGYRVHFPGGKGQWRKTDLSSPCNVEVKNAWNYTYTPRHVFMAWCLVKHMDNFAFTWSRDVDWLTDWLTPYLTPWRRLRNCNGARRFITVFTTAHHWFLSWARWIHSTPSHPISLRPILILSYHLRWGLPSGLFLSGFLTRILNAFLISPVRVTYPAHLTLLVRDLDKLVPTSVVLWHSKAYGPRLSQCSVCTHDWPCDECNCVVPRLLFTFQMYRSRIVSAFISAFMHFLFLITRAVCKVRGLTLLLRVGTLWRCGDGLFFDVPPLASDALLTTLHTLLENVLHAANRWSLRNFLPRTSLFMVGKAQKSHGGEIWIEFSVRLGKSGSVGHH